VIPPKKGASIASGSATILPRYEDITQDGRLQLTALMPGLGAAAWYALQKDVPAVESFAKQGIIPILRRLVIVAEGGPFSVYGPIDVEGHAELAREKDGDRLFLNMWADARAPQGTTFGARPAPDAERVPAGRVFAEHVITKPFAPKDERKVTSLAHPSIKAPHHEHAYEATEHLIEGVQLTIANVVEFGMMHTDSNQHVNSLVYPRMFEEAVHKHMGPAAKNLLARAVELRWRKPFFTGERATLRLAIVDGDLAYGSFTPVGGDEHRPSCTIKMKMG
jgi:hypothetical protein